MIQRDICNCSRLLIWAAVIVCGLASPAAQAADSNEQLDLFLAWFPGEYDNYEQAWQDHLDKAEQPHEHIHHIFYPVDAPTIGAHVFFVQQYLDGDPTSIYRQRLYRIATDEQEKAIRLTIYSFQDETAYRDGYLRPEIFAELGKDELIERPGCEVYWQKEADDKEAFFHGYMKERTCTFVSKRSGKQIYITDDLRLTPNEIWIRDEAFDEDGNRIFGNRAGIHHKNRKVQYYTGWAGVSSAGPAMAADESNWKSENDDWEFSGDLDNFSRFVIHDEGQIVPILSKAGEPSGYSVQLARLTYENTSLPILTLKLREDSSGKTLAYSWVETGSERIGINTRWAQTGLTKKPGQPSFGFSEAD
jgi:hypothetical protein